MNLKALAGHTIDLDALPESPTVLDVGCRGWDFATAILQERPHAQVVGMDPDTQIRREDAPCAFVRLALVGDDRTTARYASYSTGEGNFVTDLDSYYDAKIFHVPCVNLGRLMRYITGVSIKHWGVVKLDCEGSEFGILENWPGPIASQISVEFHDSGYTPGYGPDYDYVPLFKRLAGFGYRVVKHDLSKQGEGIAHWDSLIVLG